jgi:2-polyprenyl-6-methoxyphenol hydroxylase-like FAD-dependent oxidoreductase
MRQIAIVGSGIAGLVAAHGLRRAGYGVTLYSDRTPEQWLHESRPTGTAARFDLALSYERELGLNHWDDVAPKGEGVFLTFCPTAHNQLVRLLGRGERPFQAVDLRLQSHRWMHDLEAVGGRVEIESVDVSRLDAIAAEHDLTVVAAGRADLARLFVRDDSRSVFTKPQRNLCMIITRGGKMAVDGAPFLPVKFDFLGTDGEVFFIPYLHKDYGPAWNILFEAKPGSRMDRFGGVKSGEEAVAVAKEVVRQLFPWNSEWMRDMELADPLGWLTGAFTPFVRKPVGHLPSGRVVQALGDTAISFDPIAAQGANSAVKQARHLVGAVVAREERPFDAGWMTETFDDYYEVYARPAATFSNLLLEPITAAAQELLIAQYGSDGTGDSPPQRVANAFWSNFDDPRRVTDCFVDMEKSRALISRLTGKSWMFSAVRGRAGIAANQVRMRIKR